ncbi:MAG: hypothetical protein AAF823_11240 [Planctomycetota bacterium]
MPTTPQAVIVPGPQSPGDRARIGRRHAAWRGVRAATVLMGAAWAGSLMWAGCWLLGADQLAEDVRGVAVALAAVAWSAGLFVWMFVVSDTLCPRGWRGVGMYAELAMVAMFLAALGWVGLEAAAFAGWVW